MGAPTTAEVRLGARPPGREPRHRLPWAGVLGTVLLLSLVPSVARAQGVDTAADEIPLEPEGKDFSRLYLEGSVGLLTPLADLAPDKVNDPSAPRDPAPVFSVAISYRGGVTYFFSPMWGVAVSGMWSNPDVDLQQLRVPGETPEEGAGRLGSADFVTGAGEVVFRPLGAPRGAPLDPYLSLGGGVRHLSFSDPSLEDGTDPMATVAGGIRTSVAGPVFWSLEFRSFFSSADPTPRGARRQSDVVVTVGLGARL